jgi:hypothetical protein
MKKFAAVIATLLISSAANAEFRTALKIDQSGMDVIATNSDDRPYNCHISFRYTTENSPNGQSVNVTATAMPGISERVIHSTRGGWSQFNIVGGRPNMTCN